MAKKPSKRGSEENQGEGDRESARRFNKKEREFVESERGRTARRDDRPKTPEEERDLEEAEQEARDRALENDPEESRDYHKPS